MKGALPPNSNERRLIVSALCFIKVRPTVVEPVKVTLRTSGLAVISLPIASAFPVMMLRTPGGTPARSANTAMANAEKGVCSAGFTTIGQPAAKAGATLRVIIARGKFHGVIAAQTPTGCLITMIRRSLSGVGMTSPYVRLHSSANHSMNDAP
jgi:hypothetical protein